MKKTLTVNLGGTVYNIDEDAYRLLNDYLINLKQFFRRQEGADEIVNDIEIRIAELFAEKISMGKQVITITDVEEIIARVGKPEDFETEDMDSDTTREGSSSSESGSGQRGDRGTVKRRLFRDPDNKILGGVASGLAAYLGWDVTLVRIIMIALLFFSYFSVTIVYIIAWIIIPEAQTAAEKLSMNGEAVTVENIGKTVTDGFEKVSNNVNGFVNSGKPRSFLQKVGDVFVNIAAIILKLLLAIILVLCCPVLFLLFILLIVLLVTAFAVLIGGGAVLYQMIPIVDWSAFFSFSPIMIVLGAVSLVALIGIPLSAFFYTILRQLFHWSPMSTGTKWSLFILWILSLAIIIINLSTIGWNLPLLTLPFV